MFKNILKVLSGSLLSSVLLTGINTNYDNNISTLSNYDSITPIGYDEDDDLYCDWSYINGDVSGSSSMSIDYHIQNINGNLTFAFEVDKTKSDVFTFRIYFYEMENDGYGLYQFTTSDELYDYQNMNDVYDYNTGLSIEQDGVYCDLWECKINSSSLDNYLYFNLNTSQIGDCRFNIEYYGSDNVAPVITSTIDELTIDIAEPYEITKEYLLGLNAFRVVDNVDGDITSKMVVKTSNINYTKVGNYELLLEWEDSSGNVAQKSIVVKVISNRKDDEEDSSSTDKDNSSSSNGDNDSSSNGWINIFKTIWTWIVKFVKWIISLFTK